MIKTSILVKKIRDIKGAFHARMGTIKDRNGKDLTETDEIKKRWQEYTEELYETDLNDLDNRDDVVTHLEPDTLEYEVKWALGSITINKACGGDGIQAVLLKSYRMMLLKCCTQYASKFGKTQQWPQNWKRSVFIPGAKKGQCQRMFKLPHN